MIPDMSDISKSPSDRKPAWREVVRDWYLNRRFKDAVQRAAQKHLHGDLKNSAVRIQTFRAEDEAVRAQVMMELRHANEVNTAGNTAPALSALLGGVTVAVTLFATLVFAMFNGFFAALVKMTNAETGLVGGITEQQVKDTVSAVVILLACLALAVIVASCWAVSHARGRDLRRAVSVVWLTEFERAVALAAEADMVPESPTGPSGFWELFRGRADARRREAAGRFSERADY